jgi:hypothetical protein
VIEILDIHELRPAFSAQNTSPFSPFRLKTEANRTHEKLWAFSPKKLKKPKISVATLTKSYRQNHTEYNIYCSELRRKLLLVLLIKKAGAKAKFFSTTLEAGAEQFDLIYYYAFRGSHDDKI